MYRFILVNTQSATIISRHKTYANMKRAADKLGSMVAVVYAIAEKGGQGVKVNGPGRLGIGKLRPMTTEDIEE